MRCEASWAVKIWRVCLTNLRNFHPSKAPQTQRNLHVFSWYQAIFFVQVPSISNWGNRPFDFCSQKKWKQKFSQKYRLHPARDLKNPQLLQLSVCPWPNNHWKGKDHSPGGYQNADLQVSYKASLSPERTETSCFTRKWHHQMWIAWVVKIPLHFASVQPALGFKIKLLKGDHRFRTKVHPSFWLPKKVIIERIICQKMSPPHPMPFTSMVLLMSSPSNHQVHWWLYDRVPWFNRRV